MTICPCCVIPTISVQLLVTAGALLYGQRFFIPETYTLTRRVVFWLTAIVSFLLGMLGVALFVLNVNDDLREWAFATMYARHGVKSTKLDEYRCPIMEDHVRGRVLELGPGPGTNFKCFRNYSSLIDEYVAVEPNVHFQKPLQDEKNRQGFTFPTSFVGLKGENIDLTAIGDKSFDAVISTHVLCSVESPSSVLYNIEKALKPGGQYVFLEHVAGEPGTLTTRLQNFIAPALTILGNGCKFLETEKLIRDEFGDRFDINVTRFDAPIPINFLKPHVMGVATKK